MSSFRKAFDHGKVDAVICDKQREESLQRNCTMHTRAHTKLAFLFANCQKGPICFHSNTTQFFRLQAP